MGAPAIGELWRQKLAPPRAAFPVLAREQTADLAAPRDGVGLVVVQAPAGFGKTSLMRTVYERRIESGASAAWLSLDSADNDPQRFLEYLDLALRGSTASGPATYETVTSVLADLIASGEEAFVFLDDIHLISDGTVIGIIRDLATSIQGNGTLFLGGRKMPELHLGRLRAQGHIMDVGADELRFTASESEQLMMSIIGRRIEPEVVASLHERTEGWPAVLQLAGLTLEKRSDHAEFVAGFSADSADLGSYLAEELLATQRDEIRELMLRASVCETLCAELCDEVRQSTDSESLLREVERDNLCLFRLDSEGEWFRFHDLFREYLLNELRRHHRDEVPKLHRRAAEWFKRDEKMTTALDHATLSGDTEYAADMADEFSQPLVAAGRLNTLIRAAQPLPKSAIDQRPRLKVYYTVCLSGAFQHRTAAPLLDELGETGVMESLDPLTRGALLFEIPFSMVLQDRFAEALEACETNIPLLDPDDAQNRTGLSNIRSVCLLHLRRYREIEQVEADVRALAAGVTTYGLVYAECLAGMSELAQGRLSNATAIFQSALTTSVNDASADSAPTAIAAACLAEALYEAGQTDRAAKLYERYLATITHLAIPDGVIHAHAHHIRLVYASRGYEEACEAIHQFKRIGYERDLTRVAATAWAEHSRLALLQGDLPAASRYLQMAEVNGTYTTLWDESGATLRARLLVAEGHPARALALLDAELAELDSESCRRQSLKLRIVRAEALRASGRTTEALKVLGECVEEARRESFVRLIADEGDAIAGLLRELLARGVADAGSREFIDSVLALLDSEHSEAPEPDAPHETLSVREMEVLGHIADGLSNQAIANELVLSLPTVKSHVRNILSKLPAKNRTEAVAKARTRNLLSG